MGLTKHHTAHAPSRTHILTCLLFSPPAPPPCLVRQICQQSVSQFQTLSSQSTAQSMSTEPLLRSPSPSPSHSPSPQSPSAGPRSLCGSSLRLLRPVLRRSNRGEFGQSKSTAHPPESKPQPTSSNPPTGCPMWPPVIVRRPPRTPRITTPPPLPFPLIFILYPSPWHYPPPRGPVPSIFSDPLCPNFIWCAQSSQHTAYLFPRPLTRPLTVVRLGIASERAGLEDLPTAPPPRFARPVSTPPPSREGAAKYHPPSPSFLIFPLPGCDGCRTVQVPP